MQHDLDKVVVYAIITKMVSVTVIESALVRVTICFEGIELSQHHVYFTKLNDKMVIS